MALPEGVCVPMGPDFGVSKNHFKLTLFPTCSTAVPVPSLMLAVTFLSHDGGDCYLSGTVSSIKPFKVPSTVT